jgi:phosphoribosylanthranilate isomerase
MQNIKVKICGIRSLETAIACVEFGADFIGLNFVPTSKRKISVEKALEISGKVKGKIKLVGVFMNQSLSEINQITKEVDLDYVQLHGEESSEFIKSINTKIIKAFSLQSNFDVDETLHGMKEFDVDYYLVDRKVQGKGHILNVEKVAMLAKELPIFAAGGLNPENVKDVIKDANPFAVDVAGGIETDGKEDIEKIRNFIKACSNGF